MKSHTLRITPLLLAALAIVLPGGAPGSGELRITLELDPSKVIVDSRDGGSTVRISDEAAGHWTLTRDNGFPELPYRIVTLVLPPGHTVSGHDARASRISTRARNVSVVRVKPPIHPDDGHVSKPVTDPVLPPNLAVMESGLYPSQRTRFLGTGKWHGRTLASFAVFAVNVRGFDVEAVEEVELTVYTRPLSNERPVRATRMGALESARIEQAIRSIVSNPSGLAAYPQPTLSVHDGGPFRATAAPSLEGSPVDYLIITPDSLAAAYQRLADWKTAKGVPTVVRSIEWIEANSRRGADTQETLRLFVSDAYQQWGIRWLLLGGDTQEVPARFAYSAYYYGGSFIPVDMYFGCLDGTWNGDHDGNWGEQPDDNPDLYAEVYVSRLPTSSVAEANVSIDKVISFETPNDPEYADKVLFLAEVLFPSPWDPGDTIEFNGANIAEAAYGLYVQSENLRVTRSYETDWLYPGAVPESRQLSIDSLNAGFDQVFHVGHGFRFNMHVADENMVIPDADTLSNHDRYANLYLLNCTAVAYDFDCLGEHFLRNPDGGAVSVLGANNTAFADVSSFYMNEYARLVFQSKVGNLGRAFHDSRLPRTPVATVFDNADLWTHYIYASLGDPEMPLWTAPIESLTVTHADSVSVGVSPITVTVADVNGPVDSATVCLWKGVDDYQVQTTGPAGMATFDFSSESPGSVSVVVTGMNRARFQGYVAVKPAIGPQLTFAGLLVDDDFVGGTVGNSDGIFNAGETVDLIPDVRNVGGAATLAATATLQSPNPWITVIDSTALVDPLAAGSTAAATSAWRLTMSPNTPDGFAAEFGVSFVDATPGVWTDSFIKVVRAPAMELTTVRVDDSIGDNNGVVSDGEPFLLYVSLKNYGSGGASNLVAQLSSLDGGTVISSSVELFGTMGALSETEGPAGFQLLETSVATENLLEVRVTDSFGHQWRDTLELRAPAPPFGLSFDASFGVDRLQIQWSPSSSQDVAGYHVYRADTSGGPYERASLDVVLHTVFTDIGLTANTRYYYVVTTVDSSGNESAFSPEASASTNPPQMQGWPILIPEASSNSVVVGDINADGSLEIIVGNDFLYAFHHDGQELRDGDGEPLTWGVFSDQGADFLGPATLAKIDNEFGLDIIAASHASKEVYAFNYTGTVIPGWPKPTIDHVRGGIAVGDIDGDGTFEILTIDEKAHLYAWNTNGTEYVDGDADPLTDGVFRNFPDTGWWQYQMPSLADIDGDTKDEILVLTQDMWLHVLNEDGSDVPGWPRSMGSIFGNAGGGLAIGDIDNNGDLEIIAISRETGQFLALHHDNTVMWMRFGPLNQFFSPSPALADLTGDGFLETVIPSSNGRLYTIDKTGADLPGWPVTFTTTSWTESSPIIADVNGDGVPDILLGSEDRQINAWDVLGNLVDGFPLVVKDAVRGTPAVFDGDADGDVEIAVSAYDRGVYVWDLASPYNRDAMPWPVFHANAHHDGLYASEFPTAVIPPGDTPPPIASRLAQNYPNPFNPSTTITFDLASGQNRDVSLVVYNVTGAKVRTIYNGSLGAGTHVHTWDGRNAQGQLVGSGIYFYRLVDSALGFVQTKKMVLLK